jgi:HEAT repeats
MFQATAFPLPLNPNLEHLKQQAKTLLKAYRAGDTETSSRIQAQLKDFSSSSQFLLADAQLVIAREYGFSSWAKLKLHVAQVKAATVKPKKLNVSARKVFIQELTNQLLGWAQNHESEPLGFRFAMMPLRDILEVRDIVIKNGQHHLLVDGLLEGLEHVKPRVRYTCAAALDHLADERCTEPLRHLLNDPVARVRRAALHSLSCDACKVAALPNRADLVPTLIDLALHDASIRVRRAATVSLVESCDPSVFPVLQKLSAEKDDMIQRTARKGLVTHETMTIV